MTTLEEWKKQQMNVVCGIMDELIKREQINCGSLSPLITQNDPSIMNVLNIIESAKDAFKKEYEPPNIQNGGDPQYNAAVAAINKEAYNLSEAARPFKIWRREFNKIIAGYDKLIDMLKRASTYNSIQTEFNQKESELTKLRKQFTDVHKDIKSPASLLANYPQFNTSDISGTELFTLLNNSYNDLIEYKLRERFAPTEIESGQIKQKNTAYVLKATSFIMYMNTKYGDTKKIKKRGGTRHARSIHSRRTRKALH